MLVLPFLQLNSAKTDILHNYCYQGKDFLNIIAVRTFEYQETLALYILLQPYTLVILAYPEELSQENRYHASFAKRFDWRTIDFVNRDPSLSAGIEYRLACKRLRRGC